MSLAPDSSNLGGNFNSPGQGWNNANNVNATFSPALPLGVWLHVAFTYDNELEMLYLNGKPVATNAIGSRPVVNSASTFRISGDDNHNVYFDGLIDDARLYRRALSGGEIAWLYSGPRTAPIIDREPVNQLAYPGTAVDWQVNALSAAPVTWQWLKNGTPLNGATNAALHLTRVQSANAGNYQVAVSNDSGSVTSRVAVLSIRSSAKPSSDLVAWWPGENHCRDIVGGDDGGRRHNWVQRRAEEGAEAAAALKTGRGRRCPRRRLAGGLLAGLVAALRSRVR